MSMQIEFVSKLMADNVDKEVLIQWHAERIKELERKATAFEQSCRVATTQIEALQKELEVKEIIIDRLVDSFDNARACLNVDVEELERLYR